MEMIGQTDKGTSYKVDVETTANDVIQHLTTDNISKHNRTKIWNYVDSINAFLRICPTLVGYKSRSVINQAVYDQVVKLYK